LRDFVRYRADPKEDRVARIVRELGTPNLGEKGLQRVIPSRDNGTSGRWAGIGFRLMSFPYDGIHKYIAQTIIMSKNLLAMICVRRCTPPTGFNPPMSRPVGAVGHRYAVSQNGSYGKL
jgi:hypothetical protein